jgi:hypothetical protein
MGRGNPKFYDLILKVLENEALYGIELFKKANSKLSEADQTKKESTFFNGLLKLMDEGKVQIDGFKKSESIKEEPLKSFHYSGFKFSLVKKNPLKILNSINNLSSDIEEIANGSYEELKRIFKTRIKEIEAANIEKWESLKENVTKRDVESEDKWWLHNLIFGGDIHFILNGNKIEVPRTNVKFVFQDKNEAKSFIKFGESEEESSDTEPVYDGLKVYSLMYPNEKLENPTIKRKIVSLSGEEEPHKNEVDLKELLTQLNKLDYDIYFSTDPTFDKEEYLEEIGFNQPVKREDVELDDIFQNIISYIKLVNSDKLNKKLAIGLIQNVKSDIILHNLVNKATDNEIELIQKY